MARLSGVILLMAGLILGASAEAAAQTLGVVFSFGKSEPFDPLVLLPGVRPPTDEDRMATANFTRITVILGFGLDL